MSSPLSLPDHLCEKLLEGNILRNQGYRGRFAPSPSGPLHLGNLRTALISWLRARICNGTWVLRVDDLDAPRNRAGAVESFIHDLTWLGLHWDGPVVLQSQRMGLYFSFLSCLRFHGRLYACRCTRSLLSKENPNGLSQKIYPGTCRHLNLDWGCKDGRLPSWRLRVGKDFFKKSGDVALRRSDGFISYHFATAIDELTLGISEVVRGEDLASSTSSQLAIMDALEQDRVRYKHVPLMLDSKGEKLAKRNSSKGLQALIDKGLRPYDVIGLLASDLKFVPTGATLSAQDLLIDLKKSNNSNPLIGLEIAS